MRTRLSVATAGLAGLALATGMVLVGGAAANAAAPTFEPDPQAVGTLALYDASGNQIVGGNVNDPIGAYAVGSNTVRAGDVKAAIFGASANAQATGTPSSAWNVDQFTGFSAYPLSSGPSNIQTLSATHPVATIGTTDETIAGLITDFPNTSTTDNNAAYANLYQIRLETANAGGSFQTGAYDELDVLVSGSTWTQVFPALPTTTVLTSQNTPAGQGASDQLTATVTVPSGGTLTAGTVTFKDGATTIASGVSVNVATGVATTTTSFPTAGVQSLTASFTPADPTSETSSTGDLSLNVVPGTTTSLGGPSSYNVGQDISLSAVVSPSTAPGSVEFFNGSTDLGPGDDSAVAGTYVLDLGTAEPAGAYAVVAKFTPTDPAAFAPSQSPAYDFTVFSGACANPQSQCSEGQNVDVSVPEGTIFLSTPYNGTCNAADQTDNPSCMYVSLALTTVGANSYLTGSGTFNDISVIDARPGEKSYTVQAQSGALSAGNATSINPANVGLSGLVEDSATDGLDGTATNVVYDQTHTAATPPVETASTDTTDGLAAVQTLITVTHGTGTLVSHGTLTVNAPLDTLPGEYKGTITFSLLAPDS